MFKEKIASGTYVLQKEGKMKVPGLVIASEGFFQEEESLQPLEQVKNVATLPGIVGYSIAMPDIHWGYGFPIGGVAATDIHTGVISPGGVGYDINCGVRLATAPLFLSQLSAQTKEVLIRKIYEAIPSGVGRSHRGKGLSEEDYQQLLTQGSRWSISQGQGIQSDLERTESQGRIQEADPNVVSLSAKERGKHQLGTIGSGNHFIEIGEIERIFIPEIAEKWGVQKGQIYILIHCGSRGFGHQVCQDTLDEWVGLGFDHDIADKQLIAAPFLSRHGQQYFHAMNAAANFAFNNRQQILHAVRKVFHEVCNISPEEIPLLYDVCHNIAKIEEHNVNGKMQKLCVHRKGATRAYGPGAKELAPIFQETGQPVLVPGDMGRGSYLMVGLGNPLTFCSACHGAGRARSRVKSLRSWKGKDLYEAMKSQGVLVKATSIGTIAEEMPDAYKDIDEVTRVTQEANLAKMVAKLKPHLVLKG